MSWLDCYSGVGNLFLNFGRRLGAILMNRRIFFFVQFNFFGVCNECRFSCKFDEFMFLFCDEV